MRRAREAIALATAPLLLMVLAVGAPPAAAASEVLPRSTADRPDDVAGHQVHALYVVPSDGEDRALDTTGVINDTVASFQSWLTSRTDGRGLRLDTSGGVLDVSFLRLSRTDAQMSSHGAFVRDEIEKETKAAGFNDPNKVYAVYYDGTSTTSCGGGAWPPDLPGNVAAIYLRGLPDDPVPCEANEFAGAGGSPGYQEFGMLHEILHTIGLVARCAPNHTRAGHVSDNPNDLMWAGDGAWVPDGWDNVVLDHGNDDYYREDDGACANLRTNPYLVGSPPAEVGGSRFVPLVPARLLDTRDGTGAPAGPVAEGGTVRLQVTGAGGVPSSGVTAVALNVTALGGTRTGFVTVYPSGESLPLASNLNTTPGLVTPNLVIVRVGDGGAVNLFASRQTHLLADVAGYYAEDAGATYRPLAPARVLDTRDGTGAERAALGPDSTLSLQVTGTGGVPTNGVTAVVLNVTSVGATEQGFVTVFPTGQARPLASNLNTAVGLIRPNLVVVKVGANGAVSLYNHSGSTHLLADVAGYYTEAGGSDYQALVPQRLLDTRSPSSSPAGPLGPGTTRALQVTDVGGVPSGATAVVLNVTAVGASERGFVTVFPAGQSRPVASNLNTTPGLITPNLVVVKVGSSGAVHLYNNNGSTHLIADVMGYYTG